MTNSINPKVVKFVDEDCVKKAFDILIKNAKTLISTVDEETIHEHIRHLAEDSRNYNEGKMYVPFLFSNFAKISVNDNVNISASTALYLEIRKFLNSETNDDCGLGDNSSDEVNNYLKDNHYFIGDADTHKYSYLLMSIVDANLRGIADYVDKGIDSVVDCLIEKLKNMKYTHVQIKNLQLHEGKDETFMDYIINLVIDFPGDGRDMTVMRY